MKIQPFDLERWMTTYEVDARYDLDESGIAPPTLRELLALDSGGQALDRLLDLPLGYSEARGTAALREALAALYDDTTPEKIAKAKKKEPAAKKPQKGPSAFCVHTYSDPSCGNINPSCAVTIAPGIRNARKPRIQYVNAAGPAR